MRYGLSVLALAAITVVACGQATFQCQPVGPFPILPQIDCEGVGATQNLSFNPQPSVEAGPNCGIASAPGAKYAFIPASGNINGAGPTPPVGGPIQRPLTGHENEIQIPIPSGAPVVSFTWEFWDGEVAFGFSLPYNDAFTVEVVDGATGLAVGPPLVYIDSGTLQGFGTPPGPSIGSCTSAIGGLGAAPELGAPIGNSGPQVYFNQLPNPLPPLAYLSVVCLNGSDNAFVSGAAIDELVFAPPCTFTLTQPSGSGSIAINIGNCTPNAGYFMPVTFAANGFPNGYLFGVAPTLPDLLAEISFGFPFLGLLDSTGSLNFGANGGIPSGLSIYAGLGIFAPSSGALVNILTPVSLLTL